MSSRRRHVYIEGNDGFCAHNEFLEYFQSIPENFRAKYVDTKKLQSETFLNSFSKKKGQKFSEKLTVFGSCKIVVHPVKSQLIPCIQIVSFHDFPKISCGAIWRHMVLCVALIDTTTMCHHLASEPFFKSSPTR